MSTGIFSSRRKYATIRDFFENELGPRIASQSLFAMKNTEK